MNICKPDTDFVRIWLTSTFPFFLLHPTHPSTCMHIFLNNNIVPVASL